jgi:hypothetical protein
MGKIPAIDAISQKRPTLIPATELLLKPLRRQTSNFAGWDFVGKTLKVKLQLG